MKRLTILLLFLAAQAYGQAYRYDGTVTNQMGHPVPGASIAVCSQPATTSTQPCSPLATLYTDLTAAIPCTGLNGCSNPVTADGNGNYYFYASGYPLTLQIYGSGLTTKIFEDQGVNPLSTELGNGTTVLDVSLQTGTGFTGKLTVCNGKVVAAAGGTCDSRGFTPSQTLTTLVNLNGGSSAPGVFILPIASISVSSGAQLNLTSGQSLHGQGVYHTNFAVAGTSPLLTTSTNQSIIEIDNIRATSGGSFMQFGDGSAYLSSVHDVQSYSQLPPVFDINGGYYSNFKRLTLLPKSNLGGRTLSLQSGLGSTTSSHLFEQTIAWNTGGTGIFADRSSTTILDLLPDTESTCVAHDIWGGNYMVIGPYGEAGGSTGLTWQANTPYAAGTCVKDSNGNRELAILSGTSGTGTPSWSNPSSDLYLGQRTNDNDIIWELLPSYGGDIIQPGSEEDIELGHVTASDYSWSPDNAVLSVNSAAGGVYSNGQCGTAQFCVPSLQTNKALTFRGGLQGQGGFSLLPITLDAPTVSAMPGTGSTSVSYAVSCAIKGDLKLGYIPPGPAGVTYTGLTGFTTTTASVPRAQLGTLRIATVSKTLSHYYWGIPLEGQMTRLYNSAALAGGSGWTTGDNINFTTTTGSGAVGTVTASAGAVTAIAITTPGSGYNPQYHVATTAVTCATGACTGLYADIVPYYNIIYLPPFSTGNGNAGYPNVRTTGCYWDVAVNDNAHSLVTNFRATATSTPGLLNKNQGVVYDYGQALTAYTAPSRNSTADTYLKGNTTIGGTLSENGGLISAGFITLSGGTGSHSFTTSYGSTPVCTANDTTDGTQTFTLTAATGSISIAGGHSSDVIAWHCMPASN